jgi:hypothetical protein
VVYTTPTSTATTSPASAPSSAEPVEVAQYRWDPDEGAFVGPERDRLPAPSSARFELDLRESKALIPVGGEIPEPPPTPPPRQNPPGLPQRKTERPPD